MHHSLKAHRHSLTDHQGEEHRADAERAAESHTEEEHDNLDEHPNAPHRPARAVVQAGHPAITRARAVPGSEVETAAEARERDAGHDHEQPDGDALWTREHVVQQLKCERDDDDVGDGPEAGPLTQRNPEQQDDSADDQRGSADVGPQLETEPLREHSPGRSPEVSSEQERVAGAEEHETDEQ